MFAGDTAVLSRRLFNDLPAILLNLALPGAKGATAAGLFGIARKVASVPLIVRQAFQYVLAPLSSAQAAHDRACMQAIYGFSTRLSIAFVIPLSVLLILIASDILSLFASEAMAALPLLVIQANFRMAFTKHVLVRRGVLAQAHVRAALPAMDAEDVAQIDAWLADIADLLTAEMPAEMPAGAPA